MTREQWLQNLDTTDDMFAAFDGIMALYSLYSVIGDYDGISISKTPGEDFQFDIELHETCNASVNDFCRVFDNLKIEVYKPWNISCTKVSEKSVHITMI